MWEFLGSDVTWFFTEIYLDLEVNLEIYLDPEKYFHTLHKFLSFRNYSILFLILC